MSTPTHETSPTSAGRWLRRLSSPRDRRRSFSFTFSLPRILHRKGSSGAGPSTTEGLDARGVPGVPRIRTPSPTPSFTRWANLVRANSQEWLASPTPGTTQTGAMRKEPFSLTAGEKKSRKLSQAEAIASLPPMVTTETIRKESSPDLTPFSDVNERGPSCASYYATASYDFASSTRALPPTPPISPEDHSIPLERQWSLALPESSQTLSPDELADCEVRFRARSGVDAFVGLSTSTDSLLCPDTCVVRCMSVDGGSLHRSESLRQMASSCCTEYAVDEVEDEPEVEVASKKRRRKRSLRESIVWNLMKRPRNLL